MGRKSLPRVPLENFREGDIVWTLLKEEIWWPVRTMFNASRRVSVFNCHMLVTDVMCRACNVSRAACEPRVGEFRNQPDERYVGSFACALTVLASLGRSLL